MQKWEYLSVYYYYDESRSYFIVDGNPISKGKEVPAIHEVLNQLGEQGWELVTTNVSKNFIFKRPKAG